LPFAQAPLPAHRGHALLRHFHTHHFFPYRSSCLLHASRTNTAGCVAEIVDSQRVAIAPAAPSTDAPCSNALTSQSTHDLPAPLLRLPHHTAANYIDYVQASGEQPQRRYPSTHFECRRQTAIARKLVRTQWVNTEFDATPTDKRHEAKWCGETSAREVCAGIVQSGNEEDVEWIGEIVELSGRCV